MPVIAAETLAAARAGKLAAVEALLRQLEPAVYNLAWRMLNHREDARDACQEILLKVVTHLDGFRGEASFSTWVFQIARNHLLRLRQNRPPETSFEQHAAKLEAGLLFAAGNPQAASPEDKVAARQVGVACTAGMLQALDDEQRLAYLLDLMFGFTSDAAAEVLGISAAAFRKRLSRARQALEGHAGTLCGRVAPAAACHCAAQVPALRALGRLPGPPADAVYDDLVRLGDAASLFRALPNDEAPAAIVGAIVAVLGSSPSR
jgi:RNA polymerase sigma factor (sigma-70 family)